MEDSLIIIISLLASLCAIIGAGNVINTNLDGFYRHKTENLLKRIRKMLIDMDLLALFSNIITIVFGNRIVSVISAIASILISTTVLFSTTLIGSNLDFFSSTGLLNIFFSGITSQTQRTVTVIIVLAYLITDYASVCATRILINLAMRDRGRNNLLIILLGDTGIALLLLLCIMPMIVAIGHAAAGLNIYYRQDNQNEMITPDKIKASIAGLREFASIYGSNEKYPFDEYYYPTDVDHIDISKYDELIDNGKTIVFAQHFYVQEFYYGSSKINEKYLRFITDIGMKPLSRYLVGENASDTSSIFENTVKSYKSIVLWMFDIIHYELSHDFSDMAILSISYRNHSFVSQRLDKYFQENYDNMPIITQRSDFSELDRSRAFCSGFGIIYALIKPRLHPLPVTIGYPVSMGKNLCYGYEIAFPFAPYVCASLMTSIWLWLYVLLSILSGLIIKFVVATFRITRAFHVNENPILVFGLAAYIVLIPIQVFIIKIRHLF